MSDADERRLVQAALRALGAPGEPRSAESVRSILANALMGFLGADRCVVAVLGPDGRLAAVEGWSIEGDRLEDPAAALSHNLLRHVVRVGAAVAIADARSDRRWRSEADQRTRRQVRSLVGYPVFAGGGLAAVVCLSHSAAPLAARADEELPLLVAQLLGPALPRRAEAAPPREEAVPAARPPAALEPFAWGGFETRSPALRQVLETAERAAASGVPILIVGEDGTGKDMLARAIHASSGRRGAFVVVSASAIPESLVEAELFGSVKGAFTGAEASREGLIAEAQGGTLFLDDIQELPDSMQAALLRALAEGVVRPLGSDATRTVDFRLIAAATLPAEELKRHGLIREDLLYRIRGMALALPPLRERPEDIRSLFDAFLREEAAGDPPRLSEAAERFLLLHPWPGNVRELKNEAQRLAAMVRGVVDVKDLSFLPPLAEAGRAAQATLSPLPQAVRETERAQVERALALSGGNKSEAARLLGITRRSLYRRLRRHT